VALQLNVLWNQVALRLGTIRVPSAAYGDVAYLGLLLLGFVAELLERVIEGVVVAARALLGGALLPARTVALTQIFFENRDDSGFFVQVVLERALAERGVRVIFELGLLFFVK
jgi:hypothetical protein